MTCRGPDGARQQRYETVDGNKKQAQARLTEIMDSLRRGQYIEPSMMPLSEYLSHWLAEKSAHFRLKTIEHHEGLIRLHINPALGHIPLATLTPLDVQRFYTDRHRSGLSAQTVIHIHRTLRQALGQAVKWELLHRNVTDSVTPPRREKPTIRPLTVSETKTLLLAAQDTDYHVPIYLAIHTGLRRGEILGLRWSDVNMPGASLTVNQTVVEVRGRTHVSEPKTDSSRRAVSVTGDTVLLLDAHRRETQSSMRSLGLTQAPFSHVCVRPDGRPIVPSALTRGYKRLATKCGIDGVRFHDLRHTHATMLLEAGVPIHQVKARLGHRSITTTVDTYGHVLPASDAAVAAILKEKLS